MSSGRAAARNIRRDDGVDLETLLLFLDHIVECLDMADACGSRQQLQVVEERERERERREGK